MHTQTDVQLHRQGGLVFAVALCHRIAHPPVVGNRGEGTWVTRGRRAAVDARQRCSLLFLPACRLAVVLGKGGARRCSGRSMREREGGGFMLEAIYSPNMCAGVYGVASEISENQWKENVREKKEKPCVPWRVRCF